MSKLIQALFETISARGDPVLTEIARDRRRQILGKDIATCCDQIAGHLARELRVGPQDRVIAVFDNKLESALLLLTGLRHGFTLCLQPTGVAADELDRLRSELGAVAVINASDTQIAGVPSLRWEELDKLSPAEPQPVPRHNPFTITFTSGSTGKPKGIVHSAESFLACAEAFNRQSGISAADRFLNVMPMYYMAGIFNGILAPLAAGASVVISDAFSTATALRFWSIIASEGITALWLSPTMLSLVTRLDRTDKIIPASLRRLFVGTGAMAAQDAKNFQLTYGLPPLQSYGLSELLYISVDDAVSPHFGTVGRALEGVILGDDDGALVISSPYSFLGYLVDGALVPHTGSFRTSDIGKITSENTLSILGRSDDIIVRGGVNVNPVDLENILLPLLGKRMFCVTGLPDAALGQKVVLVTEGGRLDDATISEAQSVIRRLPGRIQLDGATNVSKLPVGPTGKIQRAALRSLLQESQGA